MSNVGTLQLISNGNATSSAAYWGGGRGCFIVDRGTFSGATVKLQMSFDGGTTWLDVDKSGDTFVTLTAAGAGVFELPPCSIKATVSGGSPTGLYAQVRRIISN